jgi:hypothetical protein
VLGIHSNFGFPSAVLASESTVLVLVLVPELVLLLLVLWGTTGEFVPMLVACTTGQQLRVAQ